MCLSYWPSNVVINTVSVCFEFEQLGTNKQSLPTVDAAKSASKVQPLVVGVQTLVMGVKILVVGGIIVYENNVKTPPVSGN